MLEPEPRPAPAEPVPSAPVPGSDAAIPVAPPPAAARPGRVGRGIAAGAAAAVLGAVLWAVVVQVTGYKIGFAAIGIGFLVGMAIATAAGPSRLLPPAGAGLALVGCLLGDAFADAYQVAQEFDVSTFTVLRDMATDPALTAEIFKVGFAPMDLLFWAIAAYQGFKLPAARIGQVIA